MHRSLVAAQELSERVRFSGDSLRRTTEGDSSRNESVRSLFLQNVLHISDAVTPSLAGCLDRVYDRLHIPSGTVEAFVHSSPEIQAECFAGSTSECVLRFSSALVDLLDDKEFEFVAGHEIGHFLLGHNIAKMEARTESIEYYVQQRSQEISVDRIGLLSCKSLEVAVRYLMKTASGLTNKHLRFDVGTFISQLGKSASLGDSGDLTASHPSILVRCRALLWFSLNDFFIRGEIDFSVKEMANLDKQIDSDLKKFVDGPARKRVEDAKETLAMWMAAYRVVQDGAFERREQEAIADMFGSEILDRLKNFLRDSSVTDVQDTVYEKMLAARSELENIIPTSFETEFREIENRVGLKFAN